MGDYAPVPKGFSVVWGRSVVFHSRPREFWSLCRWSTFPCLGLIRSSSFPFAYFCVYNLAFCSLQLCLLTIMLARSYVHFSLFVTASGILYPLVYGWLVGGCIIIEKLNEIEGTPRICNGGRVIPLRQDTFLVFEACFPLLGWLFVFPLHLVLLFMPSLSVVYILRWVERGCGEVPAIRGFLWSSCLQLSYVLDGTEINWLCGLYISIRRWHFYLPIIPEVIATCYSACHYLEMAWGPKFIYIFLDLFTLTINLVMDSRLPSCLLYFLEVIFFYG